MVEMQNFICQEMLVFKGDQAFAYFFRFNFLMIYLIHHPLNCNIMFLEPVFERVARNAQ